MEDNFIIASSPSPEVPNPRPLTKSPMLEKDELFQFCIETLPIGDVAEFEKAFQAYWETKCSSSSTQTKPPESTTQDLGHGSTPKPSSSDNQGQGCE